MTNIKGIGASSGIALAKAYKLEMPDLTVSRDTVEDTEAEIKKLNEHKAAVEKEINKIKERASKNLSAEEAAVFDAHLMMLNDPEFASQIEGKIKDEKLNAAAALEDVATMMINMFSSMDDAYFKERAADIKDVSTRWKAHLLGKKLPDPTAIEEEVIIIANDLTPSDTSQLDKNLVKGFATNIGGRTSHSAILARSMEIPAVVATNAVMQEVNDGDFVIIDGDAGDVIVNPDEATIKEYEAKKADYEAYKAELKKLVNAESKSTDGHKVLLVANIGSPKDLEAVKAKNYRTTSTAKPVLNYVTDEVDLGNNAQSANIVKFSYSAANTVKWEYDSQNKVYERYSKGKKEVEWDTGKEVTVKNIIIEFIKNTDLTTSADDEKKGRQTMTTTGIKDGYYITNGKAIKITCEKTSRKAKTVYKDQNGNEINVNDGNTFIEICPIDSNVKFESNEEKEGE